MNKEHIEQSLQRSILFRDVDASDLAAFSEVCRIQTVPAGGYVYRQGEASEVFYIIARGEVEMIFERAEKGTCIVGRIGPGGHFGETGLLTGKPHSLSLHALSDLILICFDRRTFRNVLLANSRIHRQLDTILAERLRVAFLDQADTLSSLRPAMEATSGFEDVILLKEKVPQLIRAKGQTAEWRKALFESPAINITEKDGWLSLTVKDTTGSPQGNILVGKDSALDGKVSSLFDEQYQAREKLDSHRYGIRFDRNEAGVYDYATNHLLAKYIWGITPSENYYSDTDNTLHLRFKKDLIGGADIAPDKIRVLPH